MADFVTDDQIQEFFTIVNPKFTIDNLPDFVRASSYEEILQRTDNEWTVDDSEVTIYADGTKSKQLFLDKDQLPITSISEIIIIAKDLTETEVIVDQTDSDRQVWWDPNTGLIEFIETCENNIEKCFDPIDWQVANIWPKGLRNIKITGKFGRNTPANILSMIQLYVMLRHMSKLKPREYASGDVVMEKIGRYQYELAGKSSGGTEKIGIDGMIDYLYSLLPNTSKFMYHGV